MHSLGQRRRAVELYIKYGLKATATIRDLGYPSRAQLVSWHREWQENGGRLTDRSLEQHALEQKRAAVRHCPAHGRCDTPPPGASLDAPSARRSSPSGSTSMHPAREGQRSPGRSARPRRPLRPGAPERFQPVYVLMTRSAPRKCLRVICAVMRNVWPCITWHQV